MCSARELAHERTRDSLINYFFKSPPSVVSFEGENEGRQPQQEPLPARAAEEPHPHVHTPVSIMLYAVSLIRHCQRGWVRSKREPREAKEILNKQTNKQKPGGDKDDKERRNVARPYLMASSSCSR